MNRQEDVLRHLREALEAAAGRKMSSPRDFERLSERIFEAVHQKVSPTTLMRLWGYVKDNTMPRESTLDILAQYLGHEDWNAFRQDAQTNQRQANSTTEHEAASPAASHRLPRYTWLIGLAVLLMTGTGLFFLWQRQKAKAEASSILRIGDRFDSYDAYLRLFGITDGNSSKFPYFQQLKDEPNIVLWGPEYHHPHWHNDGNPDSLLPTITERWAPEGADSEMIAVKNAEHYYAGRRLNDLRITFMRNLNDSAFVFLGVYRFSLTQSDTTHIVFERVAEECDLNHLNQLLRLRN